MNDPLPDIDLCFKCGGAGYKTDGKSRVLCFNLAMYGDCHGEGLPGEPPRKVVQPPGRNELCPCGSGRKYKKCCMQKSNPI